MSNVIYSSFCDELEKNAITRYEKEIAAGNISRNDVVPGLPNARSGILGPAVRNATRNTLQAPAPVDPETLARRRALNERLYNAHMANPAVATGLADVHATKQPFPGLFAAGTSLGVNVPLSSGQFVRTANSGVGGLLRAIVVANHPEAENDLLTARKPVDATLNKAMAQHEFGEVTEGRKPVIRPFASHFGPEPILRENLALQGDPEAVAHMAKLRQVSSDDALVQKGIRQLGGIPDSPIPVGGKQHKALETFIDRNVGKLDPAMKTQNMMKFMMVGKNIGWASPELVAAGDALKGHLSALQRGVTLKNLPQRTLDTLRATHALNKLIKR